MKIAIVAGIVSAFVLSACGGGGDSSPTADAKVMSIAYYGAPIPQAAAPAAVAKASVARAASDGVASAQDTAATVATLTQALAAQGVTAAVTPVVMSASALHALVMSVNNGVRPTNDQLTVLPQGYAVVNFQLDDMVTTSDDPAQQAALQQFQSDLTTFILQQDLAAKETFVLAPIPTCDLSAGHTAADGVSLAESKATSDAFAFLVGSLPGGMTFDANGNTVNAFSQGHMGADCRTPDATVVNAWTQSAAERMAINFKAGFPATPSK